MAPTASQTIERDAFDALFDALAAPRLHDRRARPCATARSSTTSCSSSADLPIGWTDEQDGGHYRLRRRDDEALFGYAVGPHSWKRFQLPPDRRLWRARRDEHGGALTDFEEPRRSAAALRVPRRALVRAARDGHPRPRAGGAAATPSRAERPFVVAVNCGQAGGTCFCVSMGTGPVAERGLRPRADRGARRRPRTTSSSTSGPSAAPSVLGDVAHAGGRRPAIAARASRGARARTRADGPRARHRPASRSCSTATTSTRAGTTSPTAA